MNAIKLLKFLLENFSLTEKNDLRWIWNNRIDGLRDVSDNNELIDELIKIKKNEESCFGMWISKHDKLPNIGEKVIVLFQDKKIDMAEFKGHGDTNFFNIDLQWNVTHWMPLPETE